MEQRKDTHPVNAMTNLLQLFNNGCVSSDNGKTTETIDVSRFTILLGGAFVGLEDIIRERVCPKPKIGFNYDTPNEKQTKAELMQLATPADLTRFGIMPELMGRIGTVLTIAPLGVEMLARACMKSQTGARAATPLVNDLMRSAIVAVENELSICKVVLDADADGCCIRNSFRHSYKYDNTNVCYAIDASDRHCKHTENATVGAGAVR